MSDHLSDQELLHLRNGAGSHPIASLEQHLEGCSGCRHRLRSQEGFDAAVRRALARESAPAALLKAVKAGLEDQAGSRGKGHSRFPGRLAAAAMAAVLILGLGLVILWLGSPAAVPEGATGSSGAAGVTQSLRGQLVCVGCARGGVDLAQQRDCPGDGDLHVTGLQTPDGNLWRFMEGELVRSYLEEPGWRGTWLRVDARTFPDIGYLQVAAVQRL